jgi:predicted ATPase/DNA-binding winged helix-turn-helix (wHTH) protein
LVGHRLQFGDFELDLGRRVLTENGRALRLGGRALDILIALTARPGETVTKDELIARVWPNTFVEEANLRVHVAALRKALGDGQAGHRYVANITGRGYSFVGTIRQLQGQMPEGAAPSAEAQPVPNAKHDLPSLRSRVVGRSDTIEALAAQLGEHGFLSIIGPGGIGKTTVAVAVAERLARSYAQGVRFIDLAPIADAALVPGTVAASLGLLVTAETATQAVIAHLRDRQMLLLLDNCEHVVDAAAFLIEEIFRAAAGVHLLVTSREALRAEGERVHRLAPLDLPPPQQPVSTVIEVMRFPAVQLFAERAIANGDSFLIRDDEAPLVADLCRRLDGIPLAIEFAAARVDQFGIQGLAQRLDDRFQVLTKGRRTALPRHQTLRATLDWSYQTLSPQEQAVLRRVSVFAGSFTLEAASAIAADGAIAQGGIYEYIAALAMKSLVSVDVSGPETRYRLLETTRAYAFAKLKECGEAALVMRNHAEFCCAVCKRGAAEWETRPAVEWLAIYGGMIDDVRAALDWAVGQGADAGLALELAALTAPLWYQLSLQEEFRQRAEQILSLARSRDDLSVAREVQLLIALGHSYLNTNGLLPGMKVAFGRALALSQADDHRASRMWALWGLWAGANLQGRYTEAAGYVEQYHGLSQASGDPQSRIISDRMMMQSNHLLGRQALARGYAEGLLAEVGKTPQDVSNSAFQIDQRTVGMAVLCRILWVQGYPDQAMATARELAEHNLRVQHLLSCCYSLATSLCLVSVLAGETAQTGIWLEDLRERATQRSLVYWLAWGQCYEAVLAGGPDREQLAALQRLPGFGPQQAEMLALNCPQALSPALLARALDSESWCCAELLRARGEQILLQDPAQAELLFERAREMARSQQALSWELRAAMSLARLRQQQGRADAGRDLLADVYGRFSEGFGTPDLRQAKALLNAL